MIDFALKVASRGHVDEKLLSRMIAAPLTINQTRFVNTLMAIESCTSKSDFSKWSLDVKVFFLLI